MSPLWDGRSQKQGIQEEDLISKGSQSPTLVDCKRSRSTSYYHCFGDVASWKHDLLIASKMNDLKNARSAIP